MKPDRRKKLITLAVRRVASLDPGEALWSTQTAIWMDVPRDEAKTLLDELATGGLIELVGDRWRTTAR
jgi:hypothetical protein